MPEQQTDVRRCFWRHTPTDYVYAVEVDPECEIVSACGPLDIDDQTAERLEELPYDDPQLVYWLSTVYEQCVEIDPESERAQQEDVAAAETRTPPRLQPEDFCRRVCEMNRSVKAMQSIYERDREAAKESKQDWEAAKTALSNFIDEWENPRPLLAAAEAADAVEDEDADDLVDEDTEAASA